MMLRKLLVAGAAAACFVTGAARAHDKADQLGKVSFPTSCSPKVQALFDTGVAMLHSYWFGEARKTFDAVLKDDPGCAMAYWGIALDYLGNSLSAPPSPKNAQAALEALDKARGIGAKTQRERDWIEALSAYYRDHDKVPVDERLLAYTRATEQLTQRYPNDLEAWVFYALNLQASASKTDTTYSNQLKSAQILEKLLTRIPDHPGVVHFLIHAYDYPPLAEKGIAAARRYAKLAPAAPHARHMPSHIYSMVGLWEESVASNLSALEVRKDYFHASDFIVYAQLQMAQDGRAKATYDQALQVAASTGVGGAGPLNTPMAAMPARLVIERGDWKAAAALPITTPNSAVGESLARFTRGLGMARTGEPAGAKRELEVMQDLRTRLEKSDNSYWADRTEEQMLAVLAWVALAEGDKGKAEELMRAAAEREDGSVKHVAMENQLYPMRELYAELLLELGQAGPALREFEAALKAYPNRYRAILGIARAADAAGDRRKAAAHYNRLTALAKNADSDRPELARARAYVAQQ